MTTLFIARTYDVDCKLNFFCLAEICLYMVYVYYKWYTMNSKFLITPNI